MLTALALDLPTDDDTIKRDWIIEAWFSDDSSARVRTAALGYLAKCGTAGDLEIARKEYDRSDYGTSRSALECMVGILLRTGQAKAAQELVLESQFEIAQRRSAEVRARRGSMAWKLPRCFLVLNIATHRFDCAQ